MNHEHRKTLSNAFAIVYDLIPEIEKQAAIDALKTLEPSADVKEEAENYANGIAVDYEEQIISQGQLRLYAKKDFIAGYLACAKKAERMAKVEANEPALLKDQMDYIKELFPEPQIDHKTLGMSVDVFELEESTGDTVRVPLPKDYVEIGLDTFMQFVKAESDKTFTPTLNPREKELINRRIETIKDEIQAHFKSKKQFRKKDFVQKANERIKTLKSWL